MATISKSLSVIDSVTSGFKQVNRMVNAYINANVNFFNTMNLNIEQNVNQAINQLPPLSLDNTQSDVESQNNSSGKTTSPKPKSKLMELIDKNITFENIKKGLNYTMDEAIKTQNELLKVQGIMGNKNAGAAYFENLKKKANSSAFSFEDLTQNAQKFVKFTKNTGSLDKLSNISQRLSLSDPNSGVNGAGDAIKDMMNGNSASLKDKFGFDDVEIGILKASKGMDDFISKFDSLLNKKGLTQGMLNDYNGSITAQIKNIKSNFKTSIAAMGMKALEVLAPIMQKVNDAFSNGSFNGIFNGIAVGINIIANVIEWLFEKIEKIGAIVQQNWSIIEPILFGAIGVMIALISITLAHKIANDIHNRTILDKAKVNMVATLSQLGLNKAILACPITKIILAIIIFITLIYLAVAIINKFAGTSISATGLIAGSFMTALAFIGNLFIALFNLILDIGGMFYNIGAMLAEFFANLFVDPLGAIIRLFADMADIVLNILQTIASVIDAVFGHNLASVVGNWRSGLKGSVKELVGDPKIKFERVDTQSMHLNRFEYGKAYNVGYKAGEKFEDKLDFNKLLNPLENADFDLNSWNKLNGQGDLGMNNFNGLGNTPGGAGVLAADDKDHLKNIDDSVDVSNEHLEVLRDLAEIESIQNFVTLTPTVQVTTGDIKEEADINTIISRIEHYMEEELASSAEGVYA